MNAAREKVRVAHALASLPNISAAFEKGELSYSKVRAMTRIATPATEETVLMWAQHSSAHHMETLASRYRKATRCRETQTADEQYQDRSLTHYYDEDGSLVIKGRFPAEQGALLIKALQLGMDRAEVEAAESIADVTAETSKRICCDSSIIPILTGKMGEPLDIGRKTRTIPPAMRRALNMRDQGCRFPGCTHR